MVFVYVGQFGTWSKIKQRVCSAAENINLGTIFAPSTIAAVCSLERKLAFCLYVQILNKQL